MWISVESAGLCRYDGHRFTVYSQLENDSNSLSSNFINEIAEDSNGFLWLASDNGLNQFNPKTKTVKHFFNEPGSPNSLPSNVCHTVYIDKNENLMVGTKNGLAIQNKDTTGFSTFFNITSPQFISKKNSILSITSSNDSIYWLGTNKGLIKFNIHSGDYSIWTNNNDGLTSKNEPVDNRILDMTIDRQGLIWIGTLKGLDRFDPQSETFKRWNYLPNDQEELEKEGISTLLLDSNNLLWVGSYTKGVVLIDPDSESYIRIHSRSQMGEFSIKSNYIRNIYQDKQGLIWIGSKFEGLFIYNGTRNIFEWPEKFSCLAPFKNEYILCFHNDSNKVFWLGTKHNGLFRISKNESTQFTANHEDTLSLPSNRIQYIIRSSNGKLWIGTDVGLVRFDESTNKFDRYCTETILWLCEDLNQKIWIGSTSGIYLANEETQGIERFKPSSQQSIFLNPNIEIPQIFCDNDNNMWFSTRFNGLYKYAQKTGCISHFTHHPDSLNNISDNMVRAIHQDKNGQLWVGTKSMGLNRFNRNGQIIKKYTTHDGLPSNMILSIEESKKGSLWLGTHNGISMLNPISNEIQNYNSNHGLQSNIAEIGASHTFPDGEMLFGGNSGFNIFDPEKLTIEVQAVKPLITSVKINDAVRFTDISTEQNVVLKRQENFISFEFILPDYNNPYRHRFMVQLQGGDNQWKKLENRNYISYTYLEPGDYSFNIKAANEYEKWADELTFHFTIKNSFYQTYWFRILVAVVLALLIAIIINRTKKRHVKLRQLVTERTKKLEIAYKELLNKNTHIREQNRQIERHQNELEQKVAERTHDLEIAKRKAEESDKLKSSFLANMSHEIRTPLNAITGFSNLISSEAVTPERKQKYVSIIKSNTNSLLKLVEDILDVSKIEAQQLKIEKEFFDLDNLVYDISTIFAEEVKLKRDEKVRLILNRTSPPESKISLYSDPIRLKQIFDNLLSNAVKFTYKGFIELGYQLKENNILFWVKDSGIGIKEKDIELIFNRFTKVETDDAIYRGTGLGLSITQSLVEMLGGRIWVESTFNAGSTFFFELPGEIKISNQHNTKNEIQKSVDLSGKKILIVEDERSNFILVQSFLIKTGIDLTWAHNGNIAIEYCKNEQYDLILLDIKMPIIDGYETFRQIKKIKAQAVVVAQTAYASPEERIKLATTGFNDYIIKPYSKDELIHKISNFL